MDNMDMIGVVKIKDGLFICDSYGAQVSKVSHSFWLLPFCFAMSWLLIQCACVLVGFGVRCCQ